VRSESDHAVGWAGLAKTQFHSAQVPTHPNAVVVLHRDLKNVVQLQPIELTIHHDQ
jgi:hypothetical protein